VSDRKPVLLWDGKCGFCKIWIDYWKLLVADRIEFRTSQEAGAEYPQIDPRAFSKSVQLIRPDGSVASGAQAVFESLGMLKTYQSSKIFAAIAEWAYRLIAAHRDAAYQFTKYTFGRKIEPTRFIATQWLFVRVLALIYAVAFASFATQVSGLIGARGILPLGEYMDAVTKGVGWQKLHMLPMVFWFGDWSSANDRMLIGFCWLGVFFSLLLIFGRMEKILLAVLYVMYMSLCSAGQDFMSFQWDALLLEAGFLAIFLGRARIVAWLFRWLVFRLFFLSGAVKLLSHDASWKNLTALDFHYHTQPLPTIFAWYMDKLPTGFQHASTFFVLTVELAMPFLIFMPRKIRHFGAWLMIGLQVLILLTGNYTIFNVLAIALCLFLFDDQAVLPYVTRFAPAKLKQSTDDPVPKVVRAFAAGFAAIMLLLTVGRMVETFAGGDAPEPLKTMVRVASPFEIANSYGLFAMMTTTRPEIIIEGSDDGNAWQTYEFRYKPGDLKRSPRWAAPFQPRLDWQMWFAALGNFREPQNRWFIRFATRLLEGSSEVEGLLENNPFPNHPPRYVRATAYEYTFSSWAEHRQSGVWWDRKLLGAYLPPVGFKSK
jgi:predicted DCC family thiol-disulfide oxidoreductase YuxK